MKNKKNILFIIICAVLALIISAFYFAPYFTKHEDKRYNDTHSSAADVEGNNSLLAAGNITSLRDGMYNVVLYRNMFSIQTDCTIARVDLLEHVSYSELYVDSLRVGDTIEGVVIKSLEVKENEYGKRILINGGVYSLYKANNANSWVLLYPSDAVVTHVTKDVLVLFPVEALYFDEMTATLMGSDPKESRINRIEDYFATENSSDWVNASIIVTNGRISEAHILYNP